MTIANSDNNPNVFIFDSEHAHNYEHKQREDITSDHWKLSISRFGVSQSLQAEFNMLRELSGLHGTNKFSAKSVDMLAQILVCRNYGNACYELSHLIWSILYIEQKLGPATTKRRVPALLDYFWIRQVATKQSFIQYFEEQIECTNIQSLGSALSVQNEQLKMHIHGHEFALNANRANFLSCVMEWLMTVIPNLLDYVEAQLSVGGNNAIRQFSSDLQKNIYAYLSEHLPPAKLQRRYRFLNDWYQQNGSKVNDSSILNFWTENYKVEGFTKYSNVVSEHLAYEEAKEAVLTEAELQYANSLETFPDANANSHSSLNDKRASNSEFAALVNVFEQYLQVKPIDLVALSTKPKALNKNQVELAEVLVLYPLNVNEFCLSWLRMQIFGKWQNNLIQAKRKNKTLDLNSLNVVPNDYSQCYQLAVQLIASNQQALFAIIGILLERGTPEWLVLLYRLDTQLATNQDHKGQLKQLAENTPKLALGNTPSLVASWQLAYPWFKRLIDQINTARKKIKRQGFNQNSLLSDDEYLLVAEQLFTLNQAITRLLKSINQKNFQHAEKFNSDRLIFINELSRIYDQEGQ